MVAYISNSQSIDDYIYELIEATKENSHFRVTYGGRIYKINPKFSKKMNYV